MLVCNQSLLQGCFRIIFEILSGIPLDSPFLQNSFTNQHNGIWWSFLACYELHFDWSVPNPVPRPYRLAKTAKPWKIWVRNKLISRLSEVSQSVHSFLTLTESSVYVCHLGLWVVVRNRLLVVLFNPLHLTSLCKFSALFSINVLCPYRENLSKNQEILKFAIISYIVITLMFDSGGYCWEKLDACHS